RERDRVVEIAAHRFGAGGRDRAHGRVAARERAHAAAVATQAPDQMPTQKSRPAGDERGAPANRRRRDVGLAVVHFFGLALELAAAALAAAGLAPAGLVPAGSASRIAR